MPMVHNWHHDAMAEHLEAVSLGQISHLLISVAPRHTKSWYVSVFWPSWHWTRWPATQWIFASYALTYAVRDSVATRRLMDTAWYQERWGCSCEEKPHAEWCEGFRWTTDQNVKEHYENDRGGRRLTASVEAGTTGHGGDILVFDDAIDIQKADSEAVRTATNKYIDQVFLGRQNDPGATRVVGVAQRTHQDDPHGHLLRESPLPWYLLKLPTEYRPRPWINGVEVPPDPREVSPIGWKDPRTEDGELLWPDRFTREIVDDQKVTLGPYGAAAQLQQDPSPLEGGILRRAWWRFWFPSGLPKEQREQYLQPVRSKEGIAYPAAYELNLETVDDTVLSLDASFKDEAAQIRKGKPPDPISLGAWARKGAYSFLLDRVNERLDIEGTIAAFVGMCERHPQAKAKLVEDKANGPAIIALLRRRVGGLIPVSPTTSKVARVMTAGVSEKDTDARAMSMVALLAAGNVFLPHPLLAPWVWTYIEQLAAFPNGKNDDDVDMTSQALLYMTPWVWREQDRAHGELVNQKGLPPITDTNEIMRRRVHEASGLAALRAAEPRNGNGHNGHNGHRPPRVPFSDPYRRGRR